MLYIIGIIPSHSGKHLKPTTIKHRSLPIFNLFLCALPPPVVNNKRTREIFLEEAYTSEIIKTCFGLQFRQKLFCPIMYDSFLVRFKEPSRESEENSNLITSGEDGSVIKSA